MKKHLSDLINRETILYLVFGLGTTIVNFFSFIIWQKILGEEYYLISNIISFVLATGFAFVTNKIWVFESVEKSILIWIRELIAFVTARMFTFVVVEEFGLWFIIKIIRVDIIRFLGFDYILVAKVFLAFVAVLVNYILSKVYVFGKREKN